MKQTFIENNFFEILTEEGFKDFSGVLISENRPVVEINLNNSKLKCTPEHRVKVNDEFIHASSISNDIVSHEDVYDLVNVQDTHSYYTNDIISHNCLALDEFAHIPHFEEFYASVLPTISAGKQTKLIFTTTPLGMNHAYKFWKDSEEGKNDFYRIFVPWNKVPGRDEAWKEKTLADMGYDYERFAQEYEVEFVGSSGTLISGWKLNELKNVFIHPLLAKDNISQYKTPDKNKKYTMVCDVSEGKGLDYSTIQVIDITQMPYEQVATYRSNMVTPVDFAAVIYRLGKLYNDCTVLIEINAMGAQVGHHLYYDLEYDNILKTTAGVGRNGKQLVFSGHKAELGLRMTNTVKATGCAILKLMIESNQLLINDYNTVEEFFRFSKKGITYQAELGAHDDMVMPLVIFGWMTEQKFFKNFTDINTLAQIKDFTEKEQDERILPFGLISTGLDDNNTFVSFTPQNSTTSEDRMEGWYFSN